MTKVYINKREIKKFFDVVKGFLGRPWKKWIKEDEATFSLRDAAAFFSLSHDSGLRIQYRTKGTDWGAKDERFVLSGKDLVENTESTGSFTSLPDKTPVPLFLFLEPVCEWDDGFLRDIAAADAFTKKEDPSSALSHVFLTAHKGKLRISATDNYRLIVIDHESAWLPDETIFIPFAQGFSQLKGPVQVSEGRKSFFVGNNRVLISVPIATEKRRPNIECILEGYDHPEKVREEIAHLLESLDPPDSLKPRIEHLREETDAPDRVRYVFDQEDVAFLLKHWKDIPCHPSDWHRTLHIRAEDGMIRVYGTSQWWTGDSDFRDTTIQLSNSYAYTLGKDDPVVHAVNVDREYFRILFETGIFVFDIDVGKDWDNPFHGQAGSKRVVLMPLNPKDRGSLGSRQSFDNPTTYLKTEKRGENNGK
jgi:hypothetical protein